MFEENMFDFSHISIDKRLFVSYNLAIKNKCSFEPDKPYYAASLGGKSRKSLLRGKKL